jgi:MFS family permease
MESEAEMHGEITPGEAHALLAAADRGRRAVIDEIAVPGWYWWGLALGWIALGVINDLANPWVTTVATVAFGAIHATVAPRVVDGRHGSDRLSVRHDVAGRRIARAVIAGVLAMAVVTVAAALAANADGAEHPATVASIFVAAIIVLGGPRLVDHLRRRVA